MFQTVTVTHGQLARDMREAEKSGITNDPLKENV